MSPAGVLTCKSIWFPYALGLLLLLSARTHPLASGCTVRPRPMCGTVNGKEIPRPSSIEIIQSSLEPARNPSPQEADIRRLNVLQNDDSG